MGKSFQGGSNCKQKIEFIKYHSEGVTRLLARIETSGWLKAILFETIDECWHKSRSFLQFSHKTAKSRLHARPEFCPSRNPPALMHIISINQSNRLGDSDQARKFLEKSSKKSGQITVNDQPESKYTHTYTPIRWCL